MSSTKNTTIKWSDSLEVLYKNPSQSKVLAKLTERNIYTLKDLLWIRPLHCFVPPQPQSFIEMKEGEIYSGWASISRIQTNKNFYLNKKRGGPLLENLKVWIKDELSEQSLLLFWFNTYTHMRKKLEGISSFYFFGKVQNYNHQLTLYNPQVFSSLEELQVTLIQYPTLNGVKSKEIKSLIKKIPDFLWDSIEDSIPLLLRERKNIFTLSKAFSVIHGKKKVKEQKEIDLAIRAIKYHEIFRFQEEIELRKKALEDKKIEPITIDHKFVRDFLGQLNFQLTPDQLKILNHYHQYFQQSHPSRVMLQGDVGCGKSIVMFTLACMVAQQKKQTLIMCPTEVLMQQHYENLLELASPFSLKIGKLHGGQKLTEKKDILDQFSRGDIQILVGTHSLIQKKLESHNLFFVIVDEQHKFGVKQRFHLESYSPSPHVMITSATPIPRSLGLALFGEMDIFTIKTKPLNRKGHKTRIITPSNYELFLKFIHARLEIGEQIYFVAPIISDSEDNHLTSVESLTKEMKKIFSSYKIKSLHGEMTGEMKNKIVREFRNNKIDILISTTVIEVGIDGPNASTIAIFNAERFGLGTLHQLRGRVGRSDKMGFCFLIHKNANEFNEVTQKRLETLEVETDGLKLAEMDLKSRGFGNLLGFEQTGLAEGFYYFHPMTDFQLILEVKNDIHDCLNQDKEYFISFLNQVSQDNIIMT